MTTSAFGVEHTVSKGLISAVTEAVPHLKQVGTAFKAGGEGIGAHVDAAVGAFKSHLGGVPKPKPMPGPGAAVPKGPKPPAGAAVKPPGMGARAGSFVRQNKKPLAIGAGAGGAVGVASSRRGS